MSTVAWREDGAMCTEYWAVFDVETTLNGQRSRFRAGGCFQCFGFGVRIVTFDRLMSSMIMKSFCNASRIRSLNWRPVLSTAVKRALVTSDPSKVSVSSHIISL